MPLIEFCKGNIFESGCEAIVNPVNTVGVMGGGLAKLFKARYPEMFHHYVRACNGMLPGDIYEWPTGNLFHPKYVLNLATKSHWRDPSEVEYIERGLEKLDLWIERNNPVSVAIPAIGCGLGGLPWGLVKARILYQFEDIYDGYSTVIKVYEPWKKTQPVKSGSPATPAEDRS